VATYFYQSRLHKLEYVTFARSLVAGFLVSHVAWDATFLGSMLP
jgi:hypothetical protein